MDAKTDIPVNTLSRRGLTKYLTNPFLAAAAGNTNEGTKRRTLKSKDGSQLMLTSQSGEQIAPAGFWHTQEVDKTQFVKLYVNGVKAFAQLSASGAMVFEIVYRQMQLTPGKDIINMVFADMDQELTPMGKTTYMRGVKELLLKGFLAETRSSGRYFINPDYAFNGDRLAIVKEFRLKRDAIDDQAWREQLESRGQQRLDNIDPETGEIT